jgi:hypothetical protein
LRVEVPESIPSGTGEPLVEVCCDAGGEGYVYFLRARKMASSEGGGVGEFRRSDKGLELRDEGRLDSGDDGASEEEEVADMVGVGRCAIIRFSVVARSA